MKVSEVTNHDGKMCALLIQFIKNGKWELTGQDAETLFQTKKWLHDVALLLAQQLKDAAAPTPAPTPVPTPAPAMRVKAMGPIAKPKKRK